MRLPTAPLRPLQVWGIVINPYFFLSLSLTPMMKNWYYEWYLLLFQLRDLIAECINPDPDKRPDIKHVYQVAQNMHMKGVQAAQQQ